jgi:hypothetical protein
MTSNDYEIYQQSLFDFAKDEETGKFKAVRRMENQKTKFLVRVLCNHKGQRCFRDEEYVRLGDKTPVVIDALYNKAIEVLGLREEDIEEKKGNSEAEKEEEGNDSSSDFA